MKKHRKIRVISLIALLLLLPLACFGPSAYIVRREKSNILPAVDAAAAEADCAIIFGAGVRNGKPTPMLRDRLLTGISLYQSGAVKKLIMSGDHGRTEYDEVNVMKAFAVERGVPDTDVFMDHAGFSTYETLYRAGAVFEAEKVILVTQTYHLYRALYIAEKLGLSAKGVSADLADYRGQFKRDIREIIARDKDFFTCMLKPKPTYLGEKIPVSGDGNLTNDRF